MVITIIKIFRFHLITGQWGDDIYSINQGDLTQRTYSWVLPDSINNIYLDPLNLEIVVFVSKDNQEIYATTSNIPTNNLTSNGSNNSVTCAHILMLLV